MKAEDHKITKTPIEERFTEFHEKWMSQLEENLQRLVKSSREIGPHRPAGAAEREALVSRVTTHLKEYYIAKWAAAHDDVLAFFSPVWLSPLENAYLWITGWKPSMAFRLIESRGLMRGESLVEMSEEQVKKVEELRVKIKLEEEKVEREMERRQVALADRKMVELAQLAGQFRTINDGLVTEEKNNVLVEVALKGLLSGLERVMKAADCVRLKTLKGLLEVLSPSQCVDFLTAILMFQVNLRKWGMKRWSP